MELEIQAARIGLELGAQLAAYVVQEIQAGATSEREARRHALQRLLDEHPLEPVLPDVKAAIADARRPASERDQG